jgi:flagellar protein FlaG
MAITPIQPFLGNGVPAGAPRPAKPAETTSQGAMPPVPVAPQAEQIKQAVQEIRKLVAPAAQSLQFSVDDATGKTIVRVVDSATKEVIRQIPSEEVLAIARALDRLQGLLLRQKA